MMNVDVGATCCVSRNAIIYFTIKEKERIVNNNFKRIISVIQLTKDVHANDL